MGSTADFCPDDLVTEWIMGVPPIVKVLADAGLGTIGKCINCFHSIAAQYIASRTIFYIDMAEERRTGSLEIMRWWEQEEIWSESEGRGMDKSYVDQE